MVKQETNGETINIGKGQPTEIRELAEMAIRLSGKDLSPEYAPTRKIEIKYRSPDTTKMEELLGMKAETPLEEGLRITFEYLKRKDMTPVEEGVLSALADIKNRA
jgi:nucleoside-diphosphate-sugar epimerase